MEFDRSMNRSVQSSVYSNRSTVVPNKYKLIVLGDSSIGKTSFILRFITSSFKEHQATTLGCDFKVKTIQLHGSKADGSYIAGDLL